MVIKKFTPPEVDCSDRVYFIQSKWYIQLTFTFRNIKLASSRRSVSWGTAKKTASENIGEKRFLSPRLSPVVSLAVFRAAPQLTERLEEA